MSGFQLLMRRSYAVLFRRAFSTMGPKTKDAAKLEQYQQECKEDMEELLLQLKSLDENYERAKQILAKEKEEPKEKEMTLDANYKADREELHDCIDEVEHKAARISLYEAAEYSADLMEWAEWEYEHPHSLSTLEIWNPDWVDNAVEKDMSLALLEDFIWNPKLVDVAFARRITSGGQDYRAADYLARYAQGLKRGYFP